MFIILIPFLIPLPDLPDPPEPPKYHYIITTTFSIENENVDYCVQETEKKVWKIKNWLDDNKIKHDIVYLPGFYKVYYGTIEITGIKTQLVLKCYWKDSGRILNYLKEQKLKVKIEGIK